MGCECVPRVMSGSSYNQFIGTYFAVCAYSTRDIVGFSLGLLNIVLWQFAQAPQLVVNYRNKTAESLSLTFLASWQVGDVANLIGCIFTNQTKIQLYTAIYFMIMDVLVLTQWVYYTRMNAKKVSAIALDPSLSKHADHAVTNEDGELDDTKLYASRSGNRLYMLAFALLALGQLTVNNISEESSLSNMMTDLKNSISSVSFIEQPSATPFVAVNAMHHSLGFQPLAEEEEPKRKIDECDDSPKLSHAAYVIGAISAWISGVQYFTARIPQIILNYRRKTTEGLSLGLFLSSTMANFCYALSVLLPNTAVLSGNHFMATTLAYLVGSLATNILSIIILVQFWYYNYVVKDSLTSRHHYSAHVHDRDEVLIEKKHKGQVSPAVRIIQEDDDDHISISSIKLSVPERSMRGDTKVYTPNTRNSLNSGKQK